MKAFTKIKYGRPEVLQLEEVERPTVKEDEIPVKVFANSANLQILASLIHNGKIKPHIERTYSYKDIPEAISHMEAMHTRGKVVMVWEHASSPQRMKQTERKG